jgi:hypothetical protein
MNERIERIRHDAPHWDWERYGADVLYLLDIVERQHKALDHYVYPNRQHYTWCRVGIDDHACDCGLDIWKEVEGEK